MTQLFSRALYIKYFRPQEQKVANEFIDMEGNATGMMPNPPMDIGIENPDVDFVDGDGDLGSIMNEASPRRD